MSRSGTKLAFRAVVSLEPARNTLTADFCVSLKNKHISAVQCDYWREKKKLKRCQNFTCRPNFWAGKKKIKNHLKSVNPVCRPCEEETGKIKNKDEFPT